ncbi:hypothetical protein SteCoe_8681 [Stentor coeruleus]|uniref:PX domain-containing protein n=1 Tax=Stentor coeruleus TaxID=5963 RepID=A0A1R2CJI7_9CILI|nr:hypothetical protein SteCoe_8681 [Stentor coeruleus]
MQGSFKPDFIENRRKILEKFLQGCCEIPYIYNFKDFQTFLQLHDTFISPKYSYQDISIILKDTFQNNCRNVVNDNYIEKAGYALKNFQTAVERLKIFEVFIEKSCKKMKKYQISFNKLMATASYTISVYLRRRFETSARDMYVNPYWVLNDWVKAEILDTEAIIEAFNILNEYGNIVIKLKEKLEHDTIKLQESQDGKKNILNIFHIKSSEETIRELIEDIQRTEADLESCLLIRGTLYFVLFESDIFTFIAKKSTIFQQSLNDFSSKTAEEFEEFIKQINKIASNFSE